MSFASSASSASSSSETEYNVGDYIKINDPYRGILKGIIFKKNTPHSYKYQFYCKEYGGDQWSTDNILKRITRQEFENGFNPDQGFIDVYNDLLSNTGQTPYVPTTDGRRKSHRRKSHRRKSHRRKSHRRKSHRI